MRRFLSLGTILFALLLSSCQILLAPVGGATNSACPVGNWQVSSETVNSIVTSIGTSLFSQAAVTVQLAGNGVAVSINADNTWILTANQSGSFNGTLAGIPVTGNGTITAHASGTYTKTATTISFAVKSLSGSLSLSGTLGGTPFTNFTISLPNTNNDDSQMELEDAYGLVGPAGYTCGSTGTLALSFTHTHLDMHFHH